MRPILSFRTLQFVFPSLLSKSHSFFFYQNSLIMASFVAWVVFLMASFELPLLYWKAFFFGRRMEKKSISLIFLFVQCPQCCIKEILTLSCRSGRLSWFQMYVLFLFFATFYNKNTLKKQTNMFLCHHVLTHIKYLFLCQRNCVRACILSDEGFFFQHSLCGLNTMIVL